MKIFIYSFCFILLCAFLISCAEDVPEPLTHNEVLGLLSTTSNNNNTNGNNGNSNTDPIIPGGDYIAYVVDNDEFPQIYLIGDDGEEKTPLTSDWTMSGYAPFWTSDGRIAYYSFMTLSFNVMNFDGTISDSINIFDQQQGLLYEPYASWSVNNKIAMSITGAMFGSADIYSIKSDGTNFMQLTISSSGYSSHPSWSPDGAELVFAYYDFNLDTSNLFIVDSGGIDIQQITFTDEEYGPDWSPNGDKIAFVSDRNGDSDIYVMNIDGTNQTNLTNTSWTYESHPSWSPDGSMIAYQSDKDGDEEIYIMKADGSNQTNLTNNPLQDDLEPAWGPR